MIIYFILALIATVIGSAAGMGGGVIIKPVLDILGDYNIVTISILSSITVFSMAVVATAKQMANGFKIEKTTVAVTVGAVLGGVIGSLIFALVKTYIEARVVTIIQSVILVILMVFCLNYMRLPKKNSESLSIKVMTGLGLGVLSSFLGIGGGPINVAVLCVLLGIKLRFAARISIFIILFAQLAGLIIKAATGMFSQVEDFTMLLVMVPAASMGGLIGTKLNKSISEKNMGRLFKSAIILVIVISVYNIFNNLVNML